MQAKTKFQKRVFALSQALPVLADKLTPWAFDNVMSHIAYKSKFKTSCLSCGHIWNTKPDEKVKSCPSCSRKLQVELGTKKTYGQTEFFSVLEIAEDFQLVRHFRMHTFHKAGKKPEIDCREIVRQFINPDGKHALVALQRGYMAFAGGDNFHGEMEIRDTGYIGTKFDVYPKMIYPKMQILPIYKRNGFTGQIGGNTVYEILSRLLTDSKTETLLKAKQFGLLACRDSYISEYWNSIKICLRNNYNVKDGTIYFDYLDLVKYFKKDLRNAEVVCPKYLKLEHDRLVLAKREIDQRKREAEDRLWAEEQRIKAERKARPIEIKNAEYAEAKGAFFGLVFTSKDITVKVLETIEEFQKEAEVHKHCVFTNDYFEKPDSLILSASVNGEPMETVEISLSKMKIVQSRGLENKASIHNPRILRLVNRNLRTIRQKLQA